MEAIRIFRKRKESGEPVLRWGKAERGIWTATQQHRSVRQENEFAGFCGARLLCEAKPFVAGTKNRADSHNHSPGILMIIHPPLGYMFSSFLNGFDFQSNPNLKNALKHLGASEVSNAYFLI